MRGGDTLSDSIDCSELKWDRGLVTVVPVSFAGVDSLDEMRLCFLLGPSLAFQDFLLLGSSSYLNLTSVHPAGITSTMFPLPINAKKEMRGGNTLSDSIDCFELNWDCSLVTVVPVSFADVDSLDKMRF